MEEVKELAKKENESDPIELKILDGLVPVTKVLGVLGSLALGIYQAYFNEQIATGVIQAIVGILAVLGGCLLLEGFGEGIRLLRKISEK